MNARFYNFHLCPRYSLHLSDGKFSFHFAWLAPSLNNLIHSNQLAPFTIVRVVRHMTSTGPYPVIYIQELDEKGIAFKEGSEPESILWTDRCSLASLQHVARLRVRISEKLIVEGPWLTHCGSRYYLFYSSSWVTSPSYKVEVAVADSVTGHYVKGDTPVIQALLGYEEEAV